MGGLLGNHRYHYFHKAFKKYHGLDFEDLEKNIERVYPFSELGFDSGGQVLIMTGEMIDGKDIYLTTNLYENVRYLDEEDYVSVVTFGEFPEGEYPEKPED